MSRKSTRTSTRDPTRRSSRESTRKSTEESIRRWSTRSSPRKSTRRSTGSKSAQPLVSGDSNIAPSPAVAINAEENQSPQSPETHPKTSLSAKKEERAVVNEDPGVTSPASPPPPEKHPEISPSPKEEGKDEAKEEEKEHEKEEESAVESKDPTSAPAPAPSSPAPAPALPPPPDPPSPWKWKCHECGRKYLLACTRRCFNCGHKYCLPKSRNRRFRRKKRPDWDWDEVCTPKFDYPGWAAWGSYRRTVAAAIRQGGGIGEAEQSGAQNKKRKRPYDEKEEGEARDYDIFATWELRPEKKRGRAPGLDSWRLRPRAERDEVARRKEDMYVLQKLSCFVHCDFPSECRYARETSLERWLKDAKDLAAQKRKGNG